MFFLQQITALLHSKFSVGHYDLMENTTMKKSIIIVALAILMVMSVFAENPIAVTTPVELVLQLTPVYSFDITTAEYNEMKLTNITTTPKKIQDADVVKDESNKKIVLTYDQDTYKLKTLNGLYVSYIFTEYNACKLSIKIDKALTYNSETIDYKASVKISESETKSVESYNSDFDLVTFSSAATKIGELTYGSYQLTIGPKNDNDTLKDKPVGTYTSNIILTLTET